MNDFPLFSPFRATTRLLLWCIVLAIFAPLQTIMLLLHFPVGMRAAVQQFLCILTCRIVGMRIRQHGKATTAGGTLYVANHSSYLDIPILGSLLSAPFVAKSEVKGWAIFGYFATINRTIYVKRSDRRGSGAQSDAMAERLAAGQSLILFPEGTSTDGKTTLPFKPTLFASALQARFIQPVSILCTGLDRLPIRKAFRPFYAWYGDMELLPHLWFFAGLPQKQIDVIFHPPIVVHPSMNRKILAQTAQQLVAKGVAALVAGHRLASTENLDFSPENPVKNVPEMEHAA